jgi:hypothetical protein
LGFGLVWAPVTGFQAELYWGADVNDDLGSGEDPRDFRESNAQDQGVHFSLNYSIKW